MKRIFFTFVLAVVAIVGVNAQLLYKISCNGLEYPSYIVGTYHLAPASFVDSIPGARDVMTSVGQVCGELDMKDMQSPENLSKINAAMLLPEGKSLSDVLSADEMDRLNAFMRETLGADLTNPMINMQLGKMTPAAISTQLQMIMYMKVTPGFNPASLIDIYFQSEATKAGKPIIGLESVDFQISVLYKGSTLERQKEQLFCMVDNPEHTKKMLKGISAAYFAKDLMKLEAIADENLGNGCDSTPEEKEALIYNRNAAWVDKVPEIVGKMPTLFVVGALHLPGERGVLELLRQKGYTVESVE